MGQNEQTPQRGVVEKTRQKTTKPSMYKVFLLNDDYTTMEFVVEILETVFGRSKVDSTSIMLHVHRNGKGLAGVFTREIAETKIAQVHAAARESGFPLKCDMEKE
ncbi:MAG: ATP-dependent Clp protease adapter ClpS [Erysipelotrichia bacterium]|nr:ATP-dependent Clp protease adapter ClpS [Erysipelotrichia bacterium]